LQSPRVQLPFAARIRQHRGWLVATAALFLALAAAEGFCRYAELPLPTRFLARLRRDRGLFELDPEVGWRPHPGRHSAFEGKTITFLADGSRDTGSPPLEQMPADIVLLGCSFTMGWDIGDDDTLAWKLRRRYPAHGVRNYGVSGYGALQSLETFDRKLHLLPAPPKLVLYGLIGPHEDRSHGDPAWQILITAANDSVGGEMKVPYATVEGDTLVPHAPVALPRWPLDDLYLVELAKLAYLRGEARGRLGQGRLVTEVALRDLRSHVEASGARFVVVFLNLSESQSKAYTRYLTENAIAYVDCAEVYDKHRDLMASDGVHPGGAMNDLFAACVGDWIDAHGALPAPQNTP
jgi:hypothetical protein